MDGWDLTFSPDGKFVYVGGGSKYCVFEFSFSPDGELKATREFRDRGREAGALRDFIGDVAVSPDGQSDLRGGFVSRLRGRDQRAHGEGERSVQNRPAAVSDFVSSRWEDVFRIELGGCVRSTDTTCHRVRSCEDARGSASDRYGFEQSHAG